MAAKDLGLAVLAVFSAVMLAYKWLSLYDMVDMGVIFFAGLLSFSIVALILRR
ncbi:hypothetical protein Asulf_00840 [Archaeoglobus sulfaticallidus PM70-1]|uniref:Uncharacterized protein n=1 Tax=Archaeoglobus sulfaticallidus PM70-1 TaxID=387631 RepID=N0BCV6_9EURY|nr:hypothetical protein [Archaeoglobus sulfaticallidus]AGK60848.1 hypothetical protein Asulf_00840 [Archaeoglobus sulfaticallidus PM70-1]